MFVLVTEGQRYMSCLSCCLFIHNPFVPAPLLNCGLQHGNENCHPVPVVIMEFRGGCRCLSHNGTKEGSESTERKQRKRGGEGKFREVS